MKVKGRFVVSDVFIGKTAVTYVTLVDMECGGMWKLSVNGVVDVKPGSIVNADLVVKGGLDPSGGSYLKFIDGTMVPE